MKRSRSTETQLVAILKEADAGMQVKASFLEAIRLDPGHVEARLRLAEIPEREGLSGEAEGHYRGARRSKPPLILQSALTPPGQNTIRNPLWLSP